jgi:hypothetical protein
MGRLSLGGTLWYPLLGGSKTISIGRVIRGIGESAIRGFTALVRHHY